MPIYNIKGKPWSYKGSIDVSDCKTSEEVIQKSNLDWEVSKCMAVAKMPISYNSENELNELLDEKNNDGFFKDNNLFREANNEYFTYRKDRYIPLGRVKGKYTVVQNIEAFNFINNIIGDHAKFDRAGFFGNGERIFVSVKINDNILINGKDPVESYLIFTNSHDGLAGVKILFTNIRIICQNTLAIAISKAKHYISFRHTNNVHDNLFIADEILGITKKQMKLSKDLYNSLFKIKLNDKEIMNYLCKANLTNDEYNRLLYTQHEPKHLINREYSVNDIAKISTKKINIISSMYDYYENGIGQENIKNTAWGAYNAITGYYSNVDNTDGIKRMDSLLYGDKFNKLINSFKLINEYN